MATYSLRCRKDACRHRRVSTVHPDDMKRRHRCPSCKGFHGWRVENRDYNQRNLCRCSGPDVTRGVSFPHKPHHPYCVQNPWAAYNVARLTGIPGGYMIGWKGERRNSDGELPLASIERRKRPTLDWPPDNVIPEGRRMLPDDPCPF
jgi:hypothetical protein